MSARMLGRVVSGCVAGIVASGLLVVAGPSAPAEQGVVVSPTPETRHPRILDGRVYSITSRGTNVLVGGTFTRVRNSEADSPELDRSRLFRFNTTTGQIDASFAPAINGDVEAVTYTADGQRILIAGDFTTVNGQPAERIAKLRLDGSLDTSFSASASRPIKDFALVGNRLIVGGEFGKFNGQPLRGLVAINPSTGALLPGFNLQIADSRDPFPPYVQELDVSANGRWLVIGGNFRRVGAAERHQVAVIDLAGGGAKIAPWSTGRFIGDCAPAYEDTYIRGIDISPDNSYFVVNTTGAFFGADQMCDTTSRWELPPSATGAGLQPTWVNHTGGDTFWAVEITESAVYVGGHMRWVNNPHPSPQGNDDGPGAVSRDGIAALDPYSGVPLSWNPGRDRGRGVEAFHATDDYLMVGSDTAFFAGQIRQRLALLPVTGGTVNPKPKDVAFPVQLYFAVAGNLQEVRFDGRSFGAVSTASGPGIDGVSWAGNRDGFVQSGRLSYFGAESAFYSRAFNNTTVGSVVRNLSTSVGYVDDDAAITPYDQPVGVDATRTAAYKGGRVYYTKTGDSRLYSRGYSLQSGILEGFETVVSTKDWSGARALEFLGNWLYAAWSDGKLYRIWAPKGQPVWRTRTIADDGTAIDWESLQGMWGVTGSGTAFPPPAPQQVTATATRSATESATVEVTVTQSVTRTVTVRRTVRLVRRYRGRLLRVSATRGVTNAVTRSAQQTASSTATKTRSATRSCTAWSKEDAQECASNLAFERASAAAEEAAVEAATETALAEGRDVARARALRMVRVYIRRHRDEWADLAHDRALRAARRKMRARIAALGG